MDSQEKIKVSVLIHCYNNENTIRKLLENLNWADEIVVCDSFSTDETVNICKEYTDKIYQYKHKNSADQKNWTIPKCKNEWIFQIDTDESVEDELIKEIEKILSSNVIEYEAFKIPRKNYLFGKWLKGAGNYPDYQERLFRNYLRYEEKPIHAHLLCKGKIGVLKGHIIHLGWEDIAQIRRRFKRHRKLLFLRYQTENRNFKFYHLILRPIGIFIYLYIFKKGFIDGWRGIFFCGFFAILEFFVLKDFLLCKRKK